jgi:hypothetical protein
MGTIDIVVGVLASVGLLIGILTLGTLLYFLWSDRL